jgi:hypothetical protein
LYKIGKTTKDAEQRKRQYQAGNARRVDVYATIKVFDSQAVETELHRQLGDYRLNYGGGDEWFDFRAVDINRVVAFMKEYDQSIPEPQPYYSYPKSSYDDFPVIPAVVIGFVALVGIGGLMFHSSHTQQLELGRMAGWKGEYVKAAQYFKKAKETSDKHCIKSYAVRMQRVTSEAAKYKAQGFPSEEIGQQFAASLKSADREAAAAKCRVR